ncbi:hypothetical protein V7419_19820 [Bacillus sp. JJ689]|uniref:hypothetical protein n=1 Tax=Bacillus sp. JJ689 TaxID=3122949 RepID=UPI002FFD968B
MMLNRVIYKNEVYYKVADLAKLFKVSAYKMRKIVKAQDIGAPLEKGSGFGRAVFVLEENVAKIVVNNQSKVLKTDFAKNPVQETITVEVEKAPSKKTKTKQQKKSAPKTKEVAVETVNAEECPIKDKNHVKAQTEQVTEVDEHQKECDELKEKIRQLCLSYVQKEKGGTYAEFYVAYIGDGELDEVATDNLDVLRDFIEALELQLEEFTAQAEISVEYEQMPAF